eukprot:CAMPEP_0197443484 /NCGR_PEP_ID=MMETSP1175-20131217/9214_1 /TAXON_ID=1003142 /ORGANISM="Triceratium dubium, Strain CCMP147" /LENGTH=501 /DNA_ID=CAMNT_0042974119 /DNA_START=163 /DNA_END=1668 /DNA_ORIENTATION=+
MASSTSIKEMAVPTSFASRTTQPHPWRITLALSIAAIGIALWFPSSEMDGAYHETGEVKANNNHVPVVSRDSSGGRCSCDVDEPKSFASSVGLHGNVSDCCCSFADIEKANRETVYPLLRRVVATPFFSHFKVDLCSSCELWDDAPLCVLRDCGVCECDEPPGWADVADWMPQETGPDPHCDFADHVDDRVVTTVDSHLTGTWPSQPVSFFDEETSTSGAKNDEDNAVVVDLRLNPERYTGYAGPSAERVWSAVHSDNCFQPDQSEGEEEETDGSCSLSAEQRVYNRIISGLHSSISLHIAHSYCLEMDPGRIAECKVWGPNATLAHERVLDRKDRLENLYVVFAVLLRAVQKVGASITAAVPVEDDFFSDSVSEWTESLLPQINMLAQNCPLAFDEKNILEEGEGFNSKRQELQRRFRHLQQIMRCVGCDRCKLWGTLQTLGIGTALRVLIQDASVAGGLPSQQALNLSRQEAVALVHTLERFSSALVFAHDLKIDKKSN